ncbi:hypothetical protein K438DRAFT_930773 [Mycena galopus ATCC 62051]|nr:hypothetical protein K438DRAFT_930773 [Mycena galopus ATCC 62051]
MSSDLRHYLLSPSSLCCSSRRVWFSATLPASMAHELVLRESEKVGRLATIRYVFYGLELAGLVGAVFMLLTAIIWRKRVRRHASWFNFTITWIISCSSYLFLMGEPLDQQPNHNLCLVQAALVYSVPTLTSGATIALVIHIYMMLRNLLTLPTNRQGSLTAAVSSSLALHPAWAMFVFSMKFGLDHPSLVRRSDSDDGTASYCIMNTTLLQRVSGIVVVIIMVLCLVVEVVIFRHLRRAWETLQKDNRSSVSTIVRVLAFTLVGMLSIILSLIFSVTPNYHNTAFNIVIAMIPVFSVIIFGTQKDLITAWGSGFQNPGTHGDDTWEIFTPNESQQTISRQVSERHEGYQL